MSSLREQILTALLARLSSIPNTIVYRSRQNAVARAEGIVLLLQPEKETSQKRTANPSGTVLRDLIVDVIVIVRGDPPDEIADPIVTAAHASIMADPTLGNLCAQMIEESTEWTFEEADLTAAEIKIRYTVRYLTNSSSLTQ